MHDKFWLSLLIASFCLLLGFVFYVYFEDVHTCEVQGGVLVKGTFTNVCVEKK